MVLRYGNVGVPTRRCKPLLLSIATLTLVGGCSSVPSDNGGRSVSAIDPMLEDAAIIKTLDNGCFVVALDAPEKGGDAEPQVVCPVVGSLNQ